LLIDPSARAAVDPIHVTRFGRRRIQDTIPTRQRVAAVQSISAESGHSLDGVPIKCDRNTVEKRYWVAFSAANRCTLRRKML
jgi:hypothetical protein